jgi:hypothetical protein
MAAAIREPPAFGYALEVEVRLKSRVCNQGRRQGRWRRKEAFFYPSDQDL